jgi:hypothetical protein
VAAFGTGGSNALVLLLLDAQHHGLLAAQIFFGLWLVPLGYLASSSGWCPRALGVLLVVGGGSYLVDLPAAFLAPDLGQNIHVFIVIPCTVAEFWMIGYLLVVGVRTVQTVQPDDRILAASGRGSRAPASSGGSRK